MNDLERLGAALGIPSLAQGPGGNASLKADSRLLVKASGKRLRDLGRPDGYADVPLDDAARALEGDAEADRRVFAARPRPSLETYFHVLGGRVVAHTHALGALLSACSSSPPPAGVEQVPYVAPGIELAQAIRRVLGTRREAVLLLKSHGLLVYADDVETAIERTLATSAACLAPFGSPRSYDEALAALPDIVESAPQVVFSELPARPDAAEARYLGPDAVVYASVLRVPALDDVATLAKEALARLGRPVVLLDDAGRRVHCARSVDELEQAREVALAHDWLEDVLGDRAIYLTDAQADAVVELPAERYRLELTRRSTASC